MAVGWLASRKVREGTAADLIVAGRSMPLWIAALTMTATWVDGGYLLGTTEGAYKNSIQLGIQGGLCFGISLILGGVFFAGIMRRSRVHDADRSVRSALRQALGGGAVPAGAGRRAVLERRAARRDRLDVRRPARHGADDGDPAVRGRDDGVHGARRDVVGRLHRHLSARRSSRSAWPPRCRSCWTAPAACSTRGDLPRGAARRRRHHPAAARRAARLWTAASVIGWWDVSLMLIFGGIPWNCYFQRVLSCRTPRDASGTVDARRRADDRLHGAAAADGRRRVRLSVAGRHRRAAPGDAGRGDAAAVREGGAAVDRPARPGGDHRRGDAPASARRSCRRDRC